jgi:hypothetical protein
MGRRARVGVLGHTASTVPQENLTRPVSTDIGAGRELCRACTRRKSSRKNPQINTPGIRPCMTGTIHRSEGFACSGRLLGA